MRERISLQIRPCFAYDKHQAHDPHIYHRARKAVDLSADDRCHFFTYFWCPGAELAYTPDDAAVSGVSE
jgi:hypothetical protein